jgi:hypothetical protein
MDDDGYFCGSRKNSAVGSSTSYSLSDTASEAAVV